MNSEALILDEGNVKITTSRIVNGSETYALRNVTKVSMKENGAIIWAGFFGIVTAVALWKSIEAANVGGVLWVAMGLALTLGLWRRAQVRKILISNASGEDQVAYVTRDKAHAERVLQALNDAIAQR
jgi:hypothetical protein